MMKAVRCASSVLERALDERFAFAVERGGRFIENEDRGIPQQRAGDGEALPLAAGEFHAALADQGVEAFGKTVDELRAVRALARRRGSLPHPPRGGRRRCSRGCCRQRAAPPAGRSPCLPAPYRDQGWRLIDRRAGAGRSPARKSAGARKRASICPRRSVRRARCVPPAAPRVRARAGPANPVAKGSGKDTLSKATAPRSRSVDKAALSSAVVGSTASGGSSRSSRTRCVAPSVFCIWLKISANELTAPPTKIVERMNRVSSPCVSSPACMSRAPYHITSTIEPKMPTMMKEMSPARSRALRRTIARKLSKPGGVAALSRSAHCQRLSRSRCPAASPRRSSRCPRADPAHAAKACGCAFQKTRRGA